MFRSSRLSLGAMCAMLLFHGVVAGAARGRWQRTIGDVQAINPYDLPYYETKYYQLYTDLDLDQVREVAVHVTKMAEVYAYRTRGFSGAINKKFPFFVFRNIDDYHAAGAPKESAGVFNGQVLMASASKQELNARTWHVIQHEGFHQFAHAVIRGDLPVWVNEGLAEYFGEGLFTGDDLITGVIPEWRRQRIKKSIESGRFKSIEQMLGLSLTEWNSELNVSNYDQAWSMVQFLAHGDDGKYQQAFIAYMNALGNGKPRAAAWKIAFGDADGFESRWKDYWSSLPENPTNELYERATVSTLTSFLARAAAQRQTFTSMEDFEQAARGKTLLSPMGEELPDSLLATALDDVVGWRKDGETFALSRPPDQKLPQIVLQARDGHRIVGKFSLRNGHVNQVTAETIAPAAPREPAGPTMAAPRTGN